MVKGRRRKQSGWSAALAWPLKPVDGAEIRTLADDARAYALALPVERSQRNQWQRAAELMLEASQSGDTRAATDQLDRALFLDMKLELPSGRP